MRLPDAAPGENGGRGRVRRLARRPTEGERGQSAATFTATYRRSSRATGRSPPSARAPSPATAFAGRVPRPPRVEEGRVEGGCTRMSRSSARRRAASRLRGTCRDCERARAARPSAARRSIEAARRRRERPGDVMTRMRLQEEHQRTLGAGVRPSLAHGEAVSASLSWRTVGGRLGPSSRSDAPRPLVGGDRRSPRAKRLRSALGGRRCVLGESEALTAPPWAAGDACSARAKRLRSALGGRRCVLGESEALTAPPWAAAYEPPWAAGDACSARAKRLPRCRGRPLTGRPGRWAGGRRAARRDAVVRPCRRSARPPAPSASAR